MTEESFMSYLDELSEAEIFYRLNGITPPNPENSAKNLLLEQDWKPGMYVYKNSIQRALGRANSHCLNHVPMNSNVVVI